MNGGQISLALDVVATAKWKENLSLDNEKNYEFVNCLASWMLYSF